MNKILRCGIVGYGYMGEIRAAVVHKHPDLELAGVCDANSNVLEQVKDTPVFSRVEDLLAQNIDMVFICTPNRFSPEYCIKALRQGIHVFCEKPPGRNVRDIEDMRLAEGHGIKLMFGFNHRYHPGIIKAKVLIDSGRLGRILNLRGIYGKSGGVFFPKSWRNNRDVSGGGILLDQGIHMLDLFRYFCGDFQEVKCFANNSFWKFGLEDNAFVLLRNRDKQMASLHSSATLWKHTFQLDMFLEEGYIKIEGLLSKSGSYGREKLILGHRQFEDQAMAIGNPTEEVTYFDQDQSWSLEVNEFVACIREDREVKMSSSYDALQVMAMIEQAYTDAGFSFLEEKSYEKHCRL